MAYVVEHADVGMIEAGDGFGFALETRKSSPGGEATLNVSNVLFAIVLVGT
jgi:hypothetical protein